MNSEDKIVKITITLESSKRARTKATVHRMTKNNVAREDRQ